MPSPDLLKPRNGGDAHVGLGIQFISLAGCIRLFGVHGLCGTHSIWYRLFLLGLTSSGMAILEIFHVALRIEATTLRTSGGGGGGGGGGELPRCIPLL